MSRNHWKFNPDEMTRDRLYKQELLSIIKPLTGLGVANINQYRIAPGWKRMYGEDEKQQRIWLRQLQKKSKASLTPESKFFGNVGMMIGNKSDLSRTDIQKGAYALKQVGTGPCTLFALAAANEVLAAQERNLDSAKDGQTTLPANLAVRILSGKHPSGEAHVFVVVDVLDPDYAPEEVSAYFSSTKTTAKSIVIDAWYGAQGGPCIFSPKEHLRYVGDYLKLGKGTKVIYSQNQRSTRQLNQDRVAGEADLRKMKHDATMMVRSISREDSAQEAIPKSTEALFHELKALLSSGTEEQDITSYLKTRLDLPETTEFIKINIRDGLDNFNIQYKYAQNGRKKWLNQADIAARLESKASVVSTPESERLSTSDEDVVAKSPESVGRSLTRHFPSQESSDETRQQLEAYQKKLDDIGQKKDQVDRMLPIIDKEMEAMLRVYETMESAFDAQDRLEEFKSYRSELTEKNHQIESMEREMTTVENQVETAEQQFNQLHRQLGDAHSALFEVLDNLNQNITKGIGSLSNNQNFSQLEREILIKVFRKCEIIDNDGDMADNEKIILKQKVIAKAIEVLKDNPQASGAVIARLEHFDQTMLPQEIKAIQEMEKEFKSLKNLYRDSKTLLEGKQEEKTQLSRRMISLKTELVQIKNKLQETDKAKATISEAHDKASKLYREATGRDFNEDIDSSDKSICMAQLGKRYEDLKNQKTTLEQRSQRLDLQHARISRQMADIEQPNFRSFT